MSITIQVPASTSNFGPGFDCLSAALELWNHVTLEPENQEEDNPAIVREAAEIFFVESGIAKFPFRFAIEGNVPQARGLGSSVTLRMGTLLGLNALSDNPLTQSKVLELCASLEGHPDNAAAAYYGGFAIVHKTRNQVLRFDVDSSVHFILLIPEIEVSTPAARKVLPASYSREAAVENLANTAMIAAAFASRNYEALRGAFADRLHQPYRKPLVPFLEPVIEAGVAAGALGGFLSGSGSTVACVVDGEGTKIAEAMAQAVPELKAKTLIAGVDNAGARIV